MSKNFDELLLRVKECRRKKVAVAVAQDEPVLEAIREAKERGIVCIRWDNNQPGPAHNWETFGLFDRTNLTFYFPEIRNSLINSYNNAKSYYN